jgi:hypothetical protein
MSQPCSGFELCRSVRGGIIPLTYQDSVVVTVRPDTWRNESQQNHSVRGDLARAIVQGGWDLNELRPSAVSLEEIFLQLTRDGDAVETEKNSAGAAS